MDSVVAMSLHFSGGTRTRRRRNVETKPRRGRRAAEWCALLMHPPLLVLTMFRLLNNLARCHLPHLQARVHQECNVLGPGQGRLYVLGKRSPLYSRTGSDGAPTGSLPRKAHH